MKVKVQSSLIESVAWNPTPKTGNGNLRVTFKKSGTPVTYLYKNVPVTVYHGLVNADSVGMAFNRLVRPTYTHSSKG